MCVYIYVRVYVHIYLYLCTHAGIFRDNQACMDVNMSLVVSMHSIVCNHASVYVSKDVCMISQEEIYSLTSQMSFIADLLFSLNCFFNFDIFLIHIRVKKYETKFGLVLVCKSTAFSTFCMCSAI